MLPNIFHLVGMMSAINEWNSKYFNSTGTYSTSFSLSFFFIFSFPFFISVFQLTDCFLSPSPSPSPSPPPSPSQLTSSFSPSLFFITSSSSSQGIYAVSGSFDKYANLVKNLHKTNASNVKPLKERNFHGNSLEVVPPFPLLLLLFPRPRPHLPMMI